jgi:hypothetical protein
MPPELTAAAAEPQLHAPPTEESDKAVVSPTHTCATPAMAGGKGRTLTKAVDMQPVPKV